MPPWITKTVDGFEGEQKEPPLLLLLLLLLLAIHGVALFDWRQIFYQKYSLDHLHFDLALEENYRNRFLESWIGGHAVTPW